MAVGKCGLRPSFRHKQPDCLRPNTYFYRKHAQQFTIGLRMDSAFRGQRRTAEPRCMNGLDPRDLPVQSCSQAGKKVEEVPDFVGAEEQQTIVVTSERRAKIHKVHEPGEPCSA